LNSRENITFREKLEDVFLEDVGVVVFLGGERVLDIPDTRRRKRADLKPGCRIRDMARFVNAWPFA
jgi:hypothetical protein